MWRVRGVRGWTSDAKLLEELRSWHASVRVFQMVEAMRHRGHLAATLDPLRGKQSRQLSPQEPIHWRIGGRHGQQLQNIDVNRCLGAGFAMFWPTWREVP